MHWNEARTDVMNGKVVPNQNIHKVKLSNTEVKPKRAEVSWKSLEICEKIILKVDKIDLS
jgi:hypothetical protein